MNEAKLKDQQIRAQAAERILADDVFKDAIEILREKVQMHFRDCDVSDYERLMRIKMMDETINSFVQYFETVLKKGRIADDSLIHLEKDRKWQKTQAI